MRVCVRALPYVCIDCVVSMSTVRKRNQLTCLGMSKSVRNLDAWPSVSSVVVATLRALALSLKGSSMAPVRLSRAAAVEAMMV